MTQSNSKIGIQKIRLSTIDSTNNFAAKLINDGLSEHGSVILAENQTNGRGQRGSEWQSQKGKNILTSFIFKFQELDPQFLFRINAFVSIALIDFLANHGIEAQIKWPNDILVNSKKICGILVENKLAGNALAYSIAGFGLNVNQSEFGGLDEATSMSLEVKQEFDLEKIWISIIGYFQKWEVFISSEHLAENLHKMYQNNLFGLGERRQFHIESQIVEGVIKGVNPQGFLILQVGQKTHYYQNKEIVFL
jgi:BirA family biotin operon repressor/biotin-[acetyl-CoA-carboxylase] ligase